MINHKGQSNTLFYEVSEGTPVFPIVAGFVPVLTEDDDKVLSDVKKGNFNIVLGFSQRVNSTMTPMKNVLDKCKKHDLFAIAMDETLSNVIMEKEPIEALEKVAKRYKEHPALSFYLVSDEPPASKFEHLGGIVKRLHSLDPKHASIINLLPTYASPKQWGTNSYQEYLDEYIRLINPDVISFDHYPLLDTDEDDNPHRITDDFYHNIEMIRNTAIGANIPMMACIQNISYCRHRDPTEAELRWQIYSYLAYGVCGFVYFTYGTLGGPEKLGVGIIDTDLGPTHHYKEIQSLNSEILSLAPTLLNLRSIGVFHVGQNNTLPRGTQEFSSNRWIQNINGEMGILGMFKNESDIPHIIIVNKDFSNSAEYNIELSPDIAGVFELNKRSGKKQACKAPQNINLKLFFW